MRIKAELLPALEKGGGGRQSSRVVHAPTPRPGSGRRKLLQIVFISNVLGLNVWKAQLIAWGRELGEDRPLLERSCPSYPNGITPLFSLF